MKHRPARLFTPTRLNERRERIQKWLIAGLTVFIVLFGFLVFNKYLKSDLTGSVLAQLRPKEAGQSDTASRIVASIDPTYFKVFEAQPDQRGDVLVKSEDGISAYFSKDKDIAKQVYSLQTILVQARINARPPKKIDLRFEKVYVEYQ